MNIKASILRMKMIFDKDHATILVAVLAVVVSLLLALYAYLQYNVDEASQKYQFWKHINSSLQGQNSAATKLFPLLFNEAAKGQKILSEIHGHAIVCKSFKTYSGINIHHINYPVLLSENNVVDHYENVGIYNYRSILLENEYIAEAVNIKGWHKFIIGERYSDRWWINLEWNSMHIGLFPAMWAWQCAGGPQTIEIPQDSINTFKESIAIVTKDDTEIELETIPSIMEIQNLEAENMPNREIAYKSIKGFFTGVQKTNIEKTLKEISSNKPQAKAIIKTK